MIKNKLIPCIICIMVLMAMPGCIQNKEQQDVKPNTITLVSYSVETYKENMTKIGNGFIHNDSAYWYLINGTVIQTMGRQIPSIRINMSFFDENETVLDSTFTYVYNIQHNQEASFSLRVHLDYFNETEKVTFKLSEA